MPGHVLRAIVIASIMMLPIAGQQAFAQWYETRGGSGEEYAAFVSPGAQGSAVVAGYEGTGDDRDVFVWGISSSQDWTWTRDVPNDGPDTVYDMAATGYGDTYVAIDFVRNSDDPGFSILHLSGSGGVVRGPVGTGLADEIHLATRRDGTTFVIGSFRGSLDLGSTTLASTSGAEAWFLGKIGSQGGWEWAKKLSHEARGIAADDGGNVTIASNASIHRYSADGDLQWEKASPIGFIALGKSSDGGVVIVGHELQVAKLDAAGSMEWSVQGEVSHDGYARTRDVHVDHNGQIYVTGIFTAGMGVGPTWLTGEFTPVGAEGVEYFETLFTASLSPDGEWLWAFDELSPVERKAYKDENVGHAIAGDGSWVYLTGATSGSGGSDVWVAKIRNYTLATPHLQAHEMPRQHTRLEIPYSWPEVSGATAYQLQGSAVGDTTVTTTDFTAHVPRYNERYYARIRALGQDGAVSDWSSRVEVRVYLPAPEVIYPNQRGIEIPSDTVFYWHPVPEATSYQVDVWKQFAGGKVVDSVVEDTMLSVAGLEPGQEYTWHVSGLTSGESSLEGVAASPHAFAVYPATSAEGTESFPATYRLGPSYPNPFNQSTTITYRVPSATTVRITLVDMLGREVRVLVDEHVSLGEQSLRIDLTGLPNGMYFYRMEAKNFSEVRSMLLTR